MSSAAKRKGSQAERDVVAWLKANGYKYADRRLAGATLDKGDISGVPGVTIEIKNHAKMDLLAVPAVLGSGLYELYQTLKDPGTEVYSMPETFLATAIAFFVGYAVIAWLMKFISTNSYRPFVIDRVAGFAARGAGGASPVS